MNVYTGNQYYTIFNGESSMARLVRQGARAHQYYWDFTDPTWVEIAIA